MKRTQSRFPLFCACAVAACGSDPQEGHVTDQQLVGFDARHVLEIELAATLHPFEEGAPEVSVIWLFTTELQFDADQVSGWIARTGVVVDGVRATIPTSAAVAVTGASAAAGELQLDPFSVGLPDLRGVIRFDAFSAHQLDEGHHVAGEASGTFDARSGDMIIRYDFDGSFQGGPDSTAPALAEAPTVLAPFEAITLRFTEPMALEGATVSVSAGEPLSALLQPATDPNYAQMALGARITSSATWPAGVILVMSMSNGRDVAGNLAEADPLSIQILACPDSNENLGFEDTEDWHMLVRNQAYLAEAYEYLDADATAQEVLPVEGSRMALLQPNSAISAYLVPPAGTTTLRFSLGLIDDVPVSVLRSEERGVIVETYTTTEPVRVADASDLPEPSADARFTGFATLSMTIPSGGEGFWVTFRTTGGEPPVHAPVAVLDALAFE